MQRTLHIPSRTAAHGSFSIQTFYSGTATPKRHLPLQQNLVVNSSGYGRNIFARQLAGDSTYSMAVDEARIGDDGTDPAEGDTGLTSPVLTGIPIADVSISGDTVQFEWFITDAELPDGTYREFGMFASNRMITHALIDPEYDKSQEDTKIKYTFRFQ